MKREKVTSSNIASIGWEEGVLEVEFLSGGVYQYDSVGEEIYRCFLDAESKGKYFRQYIRINYTGRKIEPNQQEKPPLKLSDLKEDDKVEVKWLRCEARKWIDEYSKDDGKGGEVKQQREAAVAWIKYFFGV